MLEAPLPLPERAQCPFCSSVFSPAKSAPRGVAEPPPVPTGQPAWPTTAPPAAFVTPNVATNAATQVRAPAIGLIIGGALSLLFAVADLVLSIGALMGMQIGPPPANLPPALQNLFQPNPTQLIFATMFDGVRLVTCSLTIYGALKMQRLESYGLAITSSILSLIPCLTCCCCLGLPFGIWSLVVLNRPDVRAAFR
jgi:hypothetical protein